MRSRFTAGDLEILLLKLYPQPKKPLDFSARKECVDTSLGANGSIASFRAVFLSLWVATPFGSHV